MTVSAKDNVRLGADYLLNSKNNSTGDTRGSIAGSAVIFTAQGLTNDQVTAVVTEALAQQKTQNWTNQQLFDYLRYERHLEMDVQQQQALSLNDYLGALHGEAGIATSSSAESFNATLTTQRGLDPKSKTRRTVPVFKEQDASVRKANWKANPVGWLTKRSFFHMGQARPAGIEQSNQQQAAKGELHPSAYQTYGLLNKLYNTLLDSGIAQVQADESGKKHLLLTDQASSALTPDQQEHLQLILNEFMRHDRHLVNDGEIKRSYETKYAQDLVRYLGYLDNQGALKGTVSQAWDNDTKGVKADGKRSTRKENEVQFRPSFVGGKTGALTLMGMVPGVDAFSLLSSCQDGMTDPSFIVNLADAASKAAPIQPSAQQLHVNNQAVAQQAAQQSGIAGGAATSAAATNPDTATATPSAEEGAASIGAQEGEAGSYELDDDAWGNLNEQGISLGDAAPEEFIAQVKAAFGKSVPWAFELVGDFQHVLGAVIGNVITVNRAANGLVDRKTIKHEMVHYALRIVSPAYRQLVLRDAREVLLPKLGVSQAQIARLTDKQVEERLSKHYENVHQDYEKRAEVFKRHTKYVPDSILRLYRALRTLYDRLVKQPDFTERLFGDLENGLFRGRSVQTVHVTNARNADGSVNLDQVDFNRTAAGQRQHDYLELEKVFGSPQRREQTMRQLISVMQGLLNDYAINKPFFRLPDALNVARQSLLKQAAQTEAMRADPTSGFMLDNFSSNEAHALRTQRYWLVQPLQQAAGEVNGEQQLRGVTTPLDVMVEYLYPHLKVNNRYDDATDPYGQDGDDALSGNDGQGDSNGGNAGNKANNIATKAYYLEDKNKAAKPGVELGLLLQNLPLYVRDQVTGKYQRDASNRTVDFRSVNAGLRRAVSDARVAAQKTGPRGRDPGRCARAAA